MAAQNLCSIIDTNKTEDFVKFLRDNDKKGWVNVTIKEARSGKMYAELDTFEPQKKEVQKDLEF